MTLQNWLEENYIIRPTLMFPEIHNNLEYEYEESFDPGMRKRFEKLLTDLGMDIAISEQFAYARILIRVYSEEGVPCFEVDQKRVLRFPGADPIPAMGWTAFSLASMNGWIPEDGNLEIDYKGYHISSQMIAASVMSEIQNKLGSQPQVDEVIDKVCREHAKRFMDEAPVFSGQPITESGMDYIRSTTGLFKKAETSGLEELAERLYGATKSFSQEVEAYCTWLSTTSERFRKAMDKATNECMDTFYSLPSYCLKESIENAKAMLLKDFRFGDALRFAERKLCGNATVKNLKPEILAQIFQNTEEAYQSAVHQKIYALFLECLCERLSERTERETQTAIRNLRLTAAFLSSFCVLKPNNYGVKVDWNQNGELDYNKLRIQNSAWDASTVNMTQQHMWLKPGFGTLVWFAGERVGEAANAGGVSNKIAILRELDEKYLCGLFARKI